MSALIPVQINMVLSVLLIYLFFHAFFKMSRKEASNRLFIWIMGLVCMTLILEIASVILDNPALTQWIPISKLVNMLGFILAPLIPFLSFLFCREWITRFDEREDQGAALLKPPKSSLNEKVCVPLRNPLEKRHHAMGHISLQRFNHWLFLPLLINAAGSILSINSGVLFRITGENAYERGPLFFILPCVSFFYFGYCLLFTIRNHREFSPQGLLMFCSFFIIPVIFTLVQIRYYTSLTVWNSAAIIIIIAYVFIQNEQIYRDSMTGTESRLAYENHIRKISRKNMDTLCLIFIDIDNFKGINDLCGHSEGDKAIRAFARLIMESFPLKQRRIMRFGGDEFIIILDEKDQDKVDVCLSNLAQKVDLFNQKKEKPYKLGYSYGMGRFSDENHSIDLLMDHIDKMMYRQKQQKKDDTGT